MNPASAVTRLAALAHEGRLEIFRLLVKSGEGGMAAGEIARRLGVLPNSLSTNLNILSHAGLISSRRDGRSIIYSARYEQMGELIAFLLEDCCSGAPEVCVGVAESLDRAACCA